MADNITAFANTGYGIDVFATDDIGGVNYPRTKIVIGTNGVNDGDVSSVNPLPISMPSPQSDAFGRLRVSSPETLFDSKLLWDNSPLFWDDQEVSGAGTSSTHSAVLANVTMGVSASTAGKRVRQTYQRFNYQPGKSQQILCTGVLDASGGGAGIVRGFGYYDANNGIFLRDNEGTIQFVVRNNGSDTAVNQANWNKDIMNGSGRSGVNLDLTKTQILFIDLEWLGVGTVRVGFVVDGAIYYCHHFNHANVLTSVYMSTANLPLRYEIENTGAGAAATLVQICSTVISEGGAQSLGVARAASSGGTHVDADTENTIYALLGIRLKSGYLGCNVSIENIAVQVQTATDPCEWSLWWNPTVAGTFTYADETNSAVQIAKGATANTLTNGILIAGGYIESGNVSTGNAGSGAYGVPSALKLGASIAGALDTIVLAIRPIAGASNVDAEGTIQWRELL